MKMAKTKKDKAVKNGNAAPKILKWQLRLYIAGNTPKSTAALNILRKYCELHLGDLYSIDVVDLLSVFTEVKSLTLAAFLSKSVLKVHNVEREELRQDL